VRWSERSATLIVAAAIGLGVFAVAAVPGAGADRLKDVQSALEDEQERLRFLDLQADQLAAEITRLQEQLVAAARAVQEREDELTTLERTLAALETAEQEKTDALMSHRGDMAELLGALQRLSIEPRETLVLGWRSPMDTVITAQLLQFAVPPIEAKARRLRDELNEIAELRVRAQLQRHNIAAATDSLRMARESIKELVTLKAGLKQTTDAERQGAADRVRVLTEQADDLQELLAALPPPSEATVAAMIRLERPKDLKAFPSKRNGLLPPVRGALLIAFGQAGFDGSISQGVVLETQPEAQIVAPHDGQVVFRGPFRGYGEILIMEHRGGYHSLLAGLGRVDVVVGQWLLAGEPVGVTEAPKDGKARLYVELRRGGHPIDPWPWFESRISKLE
jgi:septal ring factor EnvC (AmiA/AmiB activator)